MWIINSIPLTVTTTLKAGISPLWPYTIQSLYMYRTWRARCREWSWPPCIPRNRHSSITAGMWTCGTYVGLVLCCYNNHCTQSHSGRKAFSSSYTLCSSIMGSRDGARGRSLKQKPWWNVTYWLSSLACSPSSTYSTGRPVQGWPTMTDSNLKWLGNQAYSLAFVKVLHLTTIFVILYMEILFMFNKLTGLFFVQMWLWCLLPPQPRRLRQEDCKIQGTVGRIRA